MLKSIYYRLGWRTNKKIIVILSDDWGGERVQSTEIRKKLKAHGIDMESNRFNRFDALETNSDLEGLYEVLTSIKDNHSNHPVITAMMNVANPDYQRIEHSDFEDYYYVPLEDTLKESRATDKVLNLYKEGIRIGIFEPQFHAREHLQITRWLSALKKENDSARKGFKHRFFGIDSTQLGLPNGGEFTEALDIDSADELGTMKNTLADGIKLFKSYFGFYPTLFTPPGMFLPIELEKTLYENHIKYIDTQKVRRVPRGGGKYRMKLHFLGQKNKHGQTYIQRNAVFEPNLQPNPVQACLQDIEKAFAYKKPAILSNHRASFVGSLCQNNKAKGLKQLNKLLSSIVEKWPDVHFMSFSKMVEEIN